MANMGFHSQHHAFLQHLIVITHDIGFLLMPPRTHSMAYQGYSIVIPVLSKLTGSELMDGACLNSYLTLLYGHPINIAHDLICALLLIRGFTYNHRARLMTRVAFVVRDIIVANDIAPTEPRITFTSISDGIPG